VPSLRSFSSLRLARYSRWTTCRQRSWHWIIRVRPINSPVRSSNRINVRHGCVVQGTLIVGETDNVGTPATDAEQGRSRIDADKLSLGIFGIEINEDSTANLFNRIAFYNYQNEQIQSVTRPSGAITVQDGTFTEQLFH
jgi:hypothetical protein